MGTERTERFVIRAARPEDADAIALLHASSWRGTYRGMMPDSFLDRDVFVNRQAAWREHFAGDDPNQFVLLAEREDRVIGFICVYRDNDPTWGALIDNLHVARDSHGRGVGTSLMRAAASWLHDGTPDRGVYLWVMEANSGARAFYERNGGRYVETLIKTDPGGGEAPNCRYVWSSPRDLIDCVSRTDDR